MSSEWVVADIRQPERLGGATQRSEITIMSTWSPSAEEGDRAQLRARFELELLKFNRQSQEPVGKPRRVRGTDVTVAG